jgi:alpha-glucosidase
MNQIQSMRAVSLGNLISWTSSPHGITGVTDNGYFKVVQYNNSIVRITISRNAQFEDFSYAVIAHPAGAPTINESDNEIEVVLENFRTVITKYPVRFKFVTNNNEVINEDDSFGTSWNGEQVTTYKKLQEGERFVGLGEKTGPLNKRGHGYQNWNTDAYAYGSGVDPLYCSTPFYLGIHSNKVYGIFLDNTFKTFFNFGASNNRFSSFAADSGEMNYYFIFDKHPASIIQHYTHLTGRMELPPLWSIGYQQCRYSYYPDKEVLSVARTFREKDIPADTLVLDIHYMDAYKIFTWNKRDFPDPKGMIVKLKQLGFNVVVMCDPGIKVEETYQTYKDGCDQDVFIKYPDGTYYTGQVWPGWCHFPDFTNPKARAWWRNQFHEYVNLGVEGFWNDMNEIATWGNMLPENIEMDFEGNKSTIRRGRNIYGFQMARSTYEATKSLMNGKRPFNLTRSGFSGIQRYAAVWTGDNVAYDEHMMLGVRMVNSMGLTGIAFAGYDVGGFVGDANSKLFARWISIGAFSPFFRGHSMINSRDSEPWSYGEEVEQIARNYIKFRYKLLPYIYSLFYEASKTGMPIQRSLVLNYPFDEPIYDGQFQHQYLFGPSLLIIPVESFKEFVKVHLPFGNWYSLYTGQQFKGDQEIIVECPVHRLPVFVKGGAIIPMQDQIHHTGELTDTLHLHIYIGSDSSSFEFYEDDGATFNYQQQQHALRLINYDPANKSLHIHAQSGSFPTRIKNWKLIMHGMDSSITEVRVNGKSYTLTHSMNQFFEPLEKYDPIKDPEPAPQEPVHTVDFPNTKEKISINW